MHKITDTYKPIYGIDRHTVQRLVFSNKDRRSGKDRSGRPRALSPEEVDKLVAKGIEGWATRTFTWKELAQACNLQVSVNFYIDNLLG